MFLLSYVTVFYNICKNDFFFKFFCVRFLQNSFKVFTFRLRPYVLVVFFCMASGAKLSFASV